MIEHMSIDDDTLSVDEREREDAAIAEFEDMLSQDNCGPRPTMQTWYCPMMHNVFDSDCYTDMDPPECGSCGSMMSTDSEQFDAAEAAYEEASIANFIAAQEKKQKGP